MTGADVLVVVPHSGVAVPAEIPRESLAGDFADLLRNVDWYTQWLYNFRDLLGNHQRVFPYCSIVLEANRHPERLDACVPLRDVNGRAVYRRGGEPPEALRRRLVARYLLPFHRQIETDIRSGAAFLFDGHSTVTARGVADNQIDLMNFQHSPFDAAPFRFSPEACIETYAAELRRRLPEVSVTVNASSYYTVYGHVCGAHAAEIPDPAGGRVPALLQETNERLYTNADHTPNVAAIERLRRAFAGALAQTLKQTAAGGAAP